MGIICMYLFHIFGKRNADLDITPVFPTTAFFPQEAPKLLEQVLILIILKQLCLSLVNELHVQFFLS